MTKLFILWIIISPLGEEPYQIKMNKPFNSISTCNSAGHFITRYMHNDLKARFPNQTYVFTLECEPFEKAIG
jgi:hypothetical protein